MIKGLKKERILWELEIRTVFGMLEVIKHASYLIFQKHCEEQKARLETISQFVKILCEARPGEYAHANTQK